MKHMFRYFLLPETLLKMLAVSVLQLLFNSKRGKYIIWPNRIGIQKYEVNFLLRRMLLSQS